MLVSFEKFRESLTHQRNSIVVMLQATLDLLTSGHPNANRMKPVHSIYGLPIEGFVTFSECLDRLQAKKDGENLIFIIPPTGVPLELLDHPYMQGMAEDLRANFEASVQESANRLLTEPFSNPDAPIKFKVGGRNYG